MTVLMFKDQFAPLVTLGAKRQTIRPQRKRPIKPGDMLDFRRWTGKAYRSKQEKIGSGVCISVNQCRVSLAMMEYGHSKIHDMRILHRMARADGFRNWWDMTEWFQAQHGLPFEGILIRWELHP